MSASVLFVLGANHHTAPRELREKLALDPGDEAGLHAELAVLPGLAEVALLNTCNRVEFYAVATDSAAPSRLQAAFCARRRFDPVDFQNFRLHLAGREAVQHLLEVAAGLDSQIVGENEILGQVKDAYAAAQARRSTGPVLNRVFQKAFQAAKHVRTNTRIAAGQVSAASIAVDLALNVFGSLSSARILLIGAGEMGEKTARAFQSRGAGPMTVASRRLERAMELAVQLGASALPFEQCESRLAEFDIVVCSTAAPHAVVSAAAAAAALKKRRARPLLFIDLAMPRDVESAVAGLQNAFLFDLEDLAAIAARNRGVREAEAARCRVILAEKTELLWRQIEPRLAAGDGTPSPIAGSGPALADGGPASR